MAAGDTTADGLRVDKWLWYARFFGSRSGASRLCASGRLRVSGRIVRKAHHTIRPGDVLTFPQDRRIRVIRVKALAERRGPAAEARALYDDLAPTEPGAGDSGRDVSVVRRDRGAGRPTKAQRRAIGRLTGEG
jgi:ribosome-associated heat shock protein Hsp15